MTYVFKVIAKIDGAWQQVGSPVDIYMHCLVRAQIAAHDLNVPTDCLMVAKEVLS